MRRLPGITRRIALSLALALAVPVATPAQHFPPDEDLELMLRYLVEDGETAGIVLGIIEADGTTRVVSYGDAGPDARPLGPRSGFEIGSITKTFTGTLLADMAARGELALDDPAAKHLPPHVTMPSRNSREITLLDLATHRSGLPRMPDNFKPADPENPYADYSVECLYTFLSSHELRRDPGAEFEYSNLGMGLLGHALERVSGQTYEVLVRERILDPLGMDMTGITLEGDLADWMTRGHDQYGDVVPYWDVIALAGAGGPRSDLEDMLRYVRANMNPPDSPLGRAMRDAHRVRDDIGEDRTIGLAWSILEYQGRQIWTHGGGTAGFSTYIGFDPELGVGFVRLANAGNFEDDIGLDFLRRGPPLDIAEVHPAPEVLQRYVGSYELMPGRAAVIRMEDEGWLTMQAPGNVRFRMHAESDTSFFLKRTPWRFWFTRDETGAVVGMVADLEGSERSGPKVSDDGPPPRVVAGNARPEAEDLPMTAEEMAPYEGTFVLEAGPRTLEVRVFIEEGRLMAQPAGQRAYRLMYQGDHEFRLEPDPAIRLVFTVENARAETLTLHQSGSAISGRRQP